MSGADRDDGHMTTDVFREVAELMFGGGGDALINKMNPSQSDLATHDRKKRALTAGLSAVGATAGAAGLGLAGVKTGSSYKTARVAGQLSRSKALKHAIGHEKLATGLIPLEIAGLGGEVMATRILHGDAKKKGKLKTTTVKKDIGEIVAQTKVPNKRNLTLAALDPETRSKSIEYTKKTGGTLRRLPAKVVTTNKVEKAWENASRSRTATAYGLGHGITGAALGGAVGGFKGVKGAAIGAAAGAAAGGSVGAVRGDRRARLNPVKRQVSVAKSEEVEVTWSGEISKANSDKQQIFGWASVVEVNGEPVVDLQGDHISPEEMEKAAYTYVQKSRKGGDMHLQDNWEPIQKSEMIESFIVTPEKREAMGLPDSVPTGWWVGFQVQDPDVWAKVKSGERTGFSIHGKGKREAIQ